MKNRVGGWPKQRRVLLASALVPFLLAACERSQPYARAGLWRPARANDANLQAMIADPADLRRGHAAPLSSGDIAAAAVARLRADAARGLADSSISSVHVGGSGAAPTGPAGAGSAADPVTPGGAAAATAGDGS